MRAERIMLQQGLGQLQRRKGLVRDRTSSAVFRAKLAQIERCRRLIFFASKTMIFSRQEIEALLDKYQKLTDKDLTPASGKETSSAESKSLVGREQKPCVRCQANRQGVFSAKPAFGHLRAA